MNLRTLVSALAAISVVGSLCTGLAAGRAWGRATAVAAVRSEQRMQFNALEEELAALQHRLERHGETQRQLVDDALDCRVAAVVRHGGMRAELALVRPAP
jgi:hypothetical protein